MEYITYWLSIVMECADAATYYLLPNAYYLLLPTTAYCCI